MCAQGLPEMGSERSVARLRGQQLTRWVYFRLCAVTQYVIQNVTQQTSAVSYRVSPFKGFVLDSCDQLEGWTSKLVLKIADTRGGPWNEGHFPVVKNTQQFARILQSRILPESYSER